MSYQVLARKWRPQTFDDVVGQDAVVKTLRTALETGRVHHAYLFTGSRGVGKTTLARLMAKEIATESGEAGELARDEIARGVSVDVVEIDGASNNSVDAIREIRENARFLPQSCKYKIFIIDEVHMLSTSAFNALLKTLEEPPAHVKFIFATTEPHKLPVTILSRCQRYDFKRISTAVITERLRYVLEKEAVKIEDEGLLIIASAAEGGMRDALSLADQVISFAGGDDGTAISGPEVTEALGLIDRRSMLALTFAILDRDAIGALKVVHDAHTCGHDLRQLAEGVCNELRNLTIARTTGSIVGYADLSETDAAEIDARATGCDPKDLQRLFSSALDSVDAVARSETPRLALELAILTQLSRPPASDVMRISEAITRLDLLARGRPVPPSSYGPPSGGSGDGSGGNGPATTVAREALQGASAPPAASAAPAASTAAPATAAAPAEAPASAPAPTSAPPATQATAAPTGPTALTSTGPLPWEGDVAPSGQAIPPRSDPPLGALDGKTASEIDSYERETAADMAAETAANAPRASAPPVAPPAKAPPAKASEPEPAASEEPEMANELRAEDELARSLPLVGVDKRWIAFIDAVSKHSLPLAGHMEHGHVVRIDDGTVSVSFRNGTHETEARRAPATVFSSAFDDVKQAHGEDTLHQMEIVPFADGAAPSIAGARQEALDEAQAALEAHARAHPVVQKALSLFGGEVRRVTRL